MACPLSRMSAIGRFYCSIKQINQFQEGEKNVSDIRSTAMVNFGKWYYVRSSSVSSSSGSSR